MQWPMVYCAVCNCHAGSCIYRPSVIGLNAEAVQQIGM